MFGHADVHQRHGSCGVLLKRLLIAAVQDTPGKTYRNENMFRYALTKPTKRPTQV